MHLIKNSQLHPSRFLATSEKGEVSAVLLVPSAAKYLLVLGHGAGANMYHRHMESLAAALCENNIATFRYNFPYMERGGKGRDSLATSLETVRAAVTAATGAIAGISSTVKLLAGGHSFGGRMTSLAQAELPLPGIEGLVFFSFPLHPQGKPSVDRAAHLSNIHVPMLFLSGTRDKLAEPDLYLPVVDGLGSRATLHLLDTADHGFRIQERSRESTEDVYHESSRILQHWIAHLEEVNDAT